MLSHSPLSSDSSSSEEELPARLAESRKKRSSAIGKADTPATPRAPSPASLPAPSEANLCSGSNCTNVNCACRTRRQSDDASLGAPVFNPICVMKRSERPEITTMRDFLPLSRKKLWLERLEVYNKGSAAVSQPAVSLSVPTPQFYSQATRSPPVNSPKPSQPSPPSLRQQRHTLSPVLPNMYPTPPSEYLHQSPLEHTYPPYSGIRGNTNGFSTRLASAMPPPPVPSRATPAHVIQTISQAPNPSFPVYSYQPSVVSTNFSQQPNRTGLTNPYQQEAFPQQSPSRSSAVASPAMMTSHGPVVHVSTAVPARPPPLPHNFAPAIHSAHPYHPAGGGHPPGTVFISGNQASRDGNTGSPHPAPVSMVPFQVGSIGRRSSVSTIPGSAPSTPGMASAEVDGFGGGDNRSFAPPSGHFFYLTQ
ncbi:hypothetical protein DFJ73DRAFT_62637 [Zopfochytrium polystomum]|nr:hypothetical protein DFJ73DRAFT_62637 [Zopfochytrium polystomum]